MDGEDYFSGENPPCNFRLPIHAAISRISPSISLHLPPFRPIFTPVIYAHDTNFRILDATRNVAGDSWKLKNIFFPHKRCLVGFAGYLESNAQRKTRRNTGLRSNWLKNSLNSQLKDSRMIALFEWLSWFWEPWQKNNKSFPKGKGNDFFGKFRSNPFGNLEIFKEARE